MLQIYIRQQMEVEQYIDLHHHQLLREMLLVYFLQLLEMEPL
jgi:positive regulator of sigma E activity